MAMDKSTRRTINHLERRIHALSRKMEKRDSIFVDYDTIRMEMQSLRKKLALMAPVVPSSNKNERSSSTLRVVLKPTMKQKRRMRTRRSKRLTRTASDEEQIRAAYILLELAKGYLHPD